MLNLEEIKDQRKEIKKIYSKTWKMNDLPGSNIQLTEKDLDENTASRMPSGLKITYSISGDKPTLKVETKDGEITETGIQRNLDPRDEGINWSRIVSTPLQVTNNKVEEDFIITAGFKNETNRRDTNSETHDSRYTISGLGRITISEETEVNTPVSPLAE